MPTDPSAQFISFQAGQVFTPGAPINKKDLFSGRIDQIRQVVDAINLPGHHAVLYGERGVGKTSLANVISEFLMGIHQTIIAPRINCDTSDNYDSLWRKVFNSIPITEQSTTAGFTTEKETNLKTLADKFCIDKKVTPVDVLNILGGVSQHATVIIILDEFDRLRHSQMPSLITDTIKMLSDHSITATLVLVGVASSVDQLITEHRSVERALMQIPMPRMSRAELHEIIIKGSNELGIKFDQPSLYEISSLSQGLPYYTHLLSLEATRIALDEETKTINKTHVEGAIGKALSKSQQSIKNLYYTATKSHRKDNLFKQVLLSCALAKTDEFGYFSAKDIQLPMNMVTKKNYEIPNYARHLKEFCEPKRGPILESKGEKHSKRFRFENPLMQPYVTLQGIKTNLIDSDTLESILNSFSSA